jgi:hypothetical protein
VVQPARDTDASKQCFALALSLRCRASEVRPSVRASPLDCHSPHPPSFLLHTPCFGRDAAPCAVTAAASAAAWRRAWRASSRSCRAPRAKGPAAAARWARQPPRCRASSR